VTLELLAMDHGANFKSTVPSHGQDINMQDRLRCETAIRVVSFCIRSGLMISAAGSIDIRREGPARDAKLQTNPRELRGKLRPCEKLRL